MPLPGATQQANISASIGQDPQQVKPDREELTPNGERSVATGRGHC